MSSREAYTWYDDERRLGMPALSPTPQYVPGPWPSRAAQMINELEGPIARRHPEIEHMKSALRRVGALAAAMSGSGSTVFGLFQRKTDALAAVTGLQGAGWHVVLTESLGRVEYARAALPRRLAGPESEGRVARARKSRLH